MTQPAQNPATATGFDYYTVSADKTGLTVLPSTGEYDPKISTELNRKIRTLPMVDKYCHDMAQLLRGRAGEGFIIVKGKGKSRVRYYVVPDTSEAIKAELKDGVLLKAAIGMQGK